MFDVTLLTPTHGFSSNSYLLHSREECAVVDPSSPYSTSYGAVKYVLLTHAHFDHMLEIDSWVNSTGATVIVSRYDSAALRDSAKNCYKSFYGIDGGYFGPYMTVDDGDKLTLGDETIEVISVPGHTPGSVIYSIGDTAFVGDLVFAGGGYGRFDLPGGDYIALMDSIHRVLEFDDSVMLLCGHNEATTVSEYKRFYNI